MTILRNHELTCGVLIAGGAQQVSLQPWRRPVVGPASFFARTDPY